jgi:hypothetical protein
MIIVLPLTVATAGAELLKLTGSPLLVVAVRLNGPAFKRLFGKAANVIVCANRFTVRVATLLRTDPLSLLTNTV